ncbi:MAG: SHD1 domain-containing protein [Pirellulales bacterium]
MRQPSFTGFRPLTSIFLVGFFLLVFPNFAHAQEDVRTWHAAAGGFSVEAELVDVRQDKVQLKKRDGSTLWVDLDKLSLADVKFVEAAMKKARSGVKGNMSGDKSAAQTKKPDAQPTSGAGEPSKEPATEDDADASMENDSPYAEPGSAVGSGTTKNPFAGMRDTQVVLGQVSAHDLVFPVVFSPFVAASSHVAGGTMIQVLNIRTGKRFEPFSVGQSVTNKALSSDGQVFAVANGFPSKISVYSTGNGKLLKELQPAEFNSINKLALLNAQQMIVFGSSAQLQAAVYDLKSGKLAKSLEVNGFANKFVASPDGKLIAVPAASGTVSLIDIKSGRKKAELAVVSDSDRSSLPISDLAFCNGGADLAVLGGGRQSELHIFNLKTNRPRVKHVLSAPVHEFAPLGSSYAGPAIESLSQNKGWIVYGRAIVDAKDGGPIWVDKSEQQGRSSPFRVLIDDNKQLALVGDFNSQRFEVVELPWSEIHQTRELVAKGGTFEDAGLPPVTNFVAEKVPDVNSGISTKLFTGSKLDVPQELADRNPFSMDKGIGVVSTIRFASPEAGVCVIAATKDSSRSNFYVKRFGNAQEPKKIAVDFATTIADCSPSGKWMASITGKSQDRVDIFDLETGKHSLAFRPPAKNELISRLSTVKFLSDDRVMTTEFDGTATVWDLASHKAVYRFKAMGQTAVFPKSEKFLSFNDSGWMVRNVADGKIEGALEPLGPGFSGIPTSIQIRPDESTAAALLFHSQAQQIAVWDLQTGKLLHHLTLHAATSGRAAMAFDLYDRSSLFVIPKNGLAELGLSEVSAIHWAGSDHMLIKWSRRDPGRFVQENSVSNSVYSLLSLKDGRLLWDYRFPLGMIFEDPAEGRIWFSEQAAGSIRLTSAELPSEDSLKHIRNAPPAKRLLQAGDSVTVEISAIISGDKLADGLIQDQLVDVVTQNLAKSNVKNADRSPLRLRVRVAQIGFSGRFGRPNQSAYLAACQITDVSNEVLWHRDQVIGVETTDDAKPLTNDEARRKQWASALAWIRKTVDPDAIYEKWYHRGVGESILTSQGERLLNLDAK